MTEDALLAEIHDRWEEDSPWLGYAAWLEERGETLRAEYLRLHAALRPELFRDRPVTAVTLARRYLDVMSGGDPWPNPAGEKPWGRWRELRYRLLDPWWVVRLDRHLRTPPGLALRGREAVRVIIGVLVRNRQLEPCWSRAFFGPDEAKPLGVGGGSAGPAAVLFINASGTGGVGKCFCVVGYPGVALPREMRRALRAGGFVPRPLSNDWTVLDDVWAEPPAAADPPRLCGAGG